LATVIPLVVGTIITLVIVLAVIGFVLQHRRHRAAVNRVREMVRERSVLRPAAASDSGDEHLTAGFSDGENDASGDRFTIVDNYHQQHATQCTRKFELQID
jgi:hypothetical protein